jgi:hypothetical protein
MDFMLDAIEQILPMGPDEWDRVADMHITAYPDANRDGLSLRRKFAALYSVLMQTGDPHCPPHVRRAKRLRVNLVQRSDATSMEDGDAVDLGFEENVDDDDDVNGNDGDQEGVANQEGVAPPPPRPLIRTPHRVSTPRRNVSTVSDMSHAMMSSLCYRMEREDSIRAAEREERRLQYENEREERRQQLQIQLSSQQMQQQSNMAMVMAIVSAINPNVAIGMQHQFAGGGGIQAGAQPQAAQPPPEEQKVQEEEHQSSDSD